MRALEGRRVLIVDDDPTQREVVAEILQLEGVTVLEAATAEDAARLLAGGADVVLMDLHGVDADALVPAVRAAAGRPALVLVSGDTRLKAHVERLGADGMLAKPYDLDDLLKAISAALAQRDAGSGAHP